MSKDNKKEKKEERAVDIDQKFFDECKALGIEGVEARLDELSSYMSEPTDENPNGFVLKVEGEVKEIMKYLFLRIDNDLTLPYQLSGPLLELKENVEKKGVMFWTDMQTIQTLVGFLSIRSFDDATKIVETLKAFAPSTAVMVSKNHEISLASKAYEDLLQEEQTGLATAAPLSGESDPK